MKGNKMKKQTLMTYTIGSGDNPTATLCNGHVDVKTFNKAKAAEGWSGDPVTSGELFHEYWEHKGRKWTKSDQTNIRAQAVTVMYW